jgi:hypothetical protein
MLQMGQLEQLVMCYWLNTCKCIIIVVVLRFRIGIIVILPIANNLTCNVKVIEDGR